MKSEKVFNQLILAHLCLLFQALLNLISDSVNFQFFAKNRPKLLKQRLQGNEGSGNVRQFYTLSHYDAGKSKIVPKGAYFRFLPNLVALNLITILYRPYESR